MTQMYVLKSPYEKVKIKMIKSMGLLLVTLLLNGCILLNAPVKPAELVASEELISKEPESKEPSYSEVCRGQLGEFCDYRMWVKYLIDNAEVKWPQRRQMIEDLSEEPVDMLKQVLLSQATDTPYQYRLRAQNTMSNLQDTVEPDIADALESLFFRPSQKQLEFESAITILTRINTQQKYENEQLSTQIEALEIELEKQREQLQKLLDIEVEMVEQDAGGN